MTTVSVITPFYNSADYIARILDSIRSQALENIEIICVDDGSSDGSAEIVKKVAATDSRVRYIRQGNAGAGMARNNGIKILNKSIVVTDVPGMREQFGEGEATFCEYTVPSIHNAILAAMNQRGERRPSFSVEEFNTEQRGKIHKLLTM